MVLMVIMPQEEKRTLFSTKESVHFFLYQDLVATTGVPGLPLTGVATGQKNLKNLKKNKYPYSHSHICSYIP